MDCPSEPIELKENMSLAVDSTESSSYRVTGLPVQSLAPMRRFHPKPYPGQSDRRRVGALRLWERLGDSVPVHRDRRTDRTYPRSPRAAAASRASTLAIQDMRLH